MRFDKFLILLCVFFSKNEYEKQLSLNLKWEHENKE